MDLSRFGHIRRNTKRHPARYNPRHALSIALYSVPSLQLALNFGQSQFSTLIVTQQWLEFLLHGGEFFLFRLDIDASDRQTEIVTPIADRETGRHINPAIYAPR